VELMTCPPGAFRSDENLITLPPRGCFVASWGSLPSDGLVSQHDGVDGNEALATMRDAAALWSVGYIIAAEVVRIACDLLVAGQDGPALRMLAAVPFRHADDEVPDVLEAALTDLGLTYYERGSRAGQEAAVRTLAARVLAGTMSPRSLAVWAHSKFGHGRLDLAERLVELDDVYDTVEYTNMTEQEVDAEVTAEARRILQESHATDPRLRREPKGTRGGGTTP
jgi:hypothetical protein